jgi:hypothetical protein
VITPSGRYYAQAKTIDAASKGMQQDDARRKEREARERGAEQQMLYGMYRVSRSRCLRPAGLRSPAWRPGWPAASSQQPAAAPLTRSACCAEAPADGHHPWLT